MSDAEESKKAKERSPAFPFITLERALERARQFYNEEKRGASPLSRAVMHWSYSPGSSGALQTVAALRQYGLMEDVGGSGTARQLRLSDLALRILLDQREDKTERDANIRTAARSPSVAAEVYDRWPDGLPSDSTLNHFLVLDRKFSDAAALSAVKILKENQGFARINDPILQSAIQDAGTENVVETPLKNLALTRADAAGNVTQQAAPVVAPVTQAPATARLVLRFKGTTIEMTFSSEPTQEVFDYLERYCAFEKGNAPSSKDLSSAHSDAGGESS